MVRSRDELAAELLAQANGLVADDPRSQDLRIAAAAITEMRESFTMFAPYREVPKVTIFGSARTKPHDPLWEQARRMAEILAGQGWMVVTGAGPGIMHAGMEGAGRERSIGVSIRLPHEQGANPIIAGDEKYVSMRYFFTRKLMLVKESKAFVCLPGGFGTLDETFELLTLTQTGKGLPVPIVLLDTPGDPYWESVDEFIREQLVTRDFVSPGDPGLYLITESCQQAAEEILGFYVNFDSVRYIDRELYIRLKSPPTDEDLEVLNRQFGALVEAGDIHRADPHPAEIAEDDRLGFARLAFRFSQHHSADLRRLIDALNRIDPLPGAPQIPASGSSN